MLSSPRLAGGGAGCGAVLGVPCVLFGRGTLWAPARAPEGATRRGGRSARKSATRLEKEEQSFYLGTNNPEDLYAIRRLLLTGLDQIPEIGEYLHRDVFDVAAKYGKDTFLSVLHLGTKRLPKLFAIKGLIDARLNKQNGNKNELFQYISTQALQWSESEKIKVDSVMQSINKDIKHLMLNIDYPNSIFFIKTTGEEEGNASGYTRSNCLILNDETLIWGFQELKNIIIHELFHIISRNNLSFREKMYEVIGFKVIKEISFPQSLIDYKVTNPDAPMINSYINLSNGEESKDYALITYSKKEFNGGSLFDYVTFGFIKLQDLNNGVKVPIIYVDGDFTNFFEQIGNNTGYIIHPDEILADNFVFLLNENNNLPSQWVVDKMKLNLQ